MDRLTDEELADAKRNLVQAKVSLACEGLALTPEQEAMFEGFERDRLLHDERLRRIIAFYTPKGRSVDAAE